MVAKAVVSAGLHQRETVLVAEGGSGARLCPLLGPPHSPRLVYPSPHSPPSRLPRVHSILKGASPGRACLVQSAGLIPSETQQKDAPPFPTPYGALLYGLHPYLYRPMKDRHLLAGGLLEGLPVVWGIRAGSQVPSPSQDLHCYHVKKMGLGTR